MKCFPYRVCSSVGVAAVNSKKPLTSKFDAAALTGLPASIGYNIKTKYKSFNGSSDHEEIIAIT